MPLPVVVVDSVETVEMVEIEFVVCPSIRKQECRWLWANGYVLWSVIFVYCVFAALWENVCVFIILFHLLNARTHYDTHIQKHTCTNDRSQTLTPNIHQTVWHTANAMTMDGNKKKINTISSCAVASWMRLACYPVMEVSLASIMVIRLRLLEN